MANQKAKKPDYNFIDPETIAEQITVVFDRELSKLGYNDFGIDYTNIKKPRYISHNQINYILRRVYIELFKPDKPLYNNQQSKIDYENMEQLTAVANCFIDICSKFNKSLGLLSFSYLTGIETSTFVNWMNGGGELNRQRLQILNKLQEGHKAAHIALLNETNLGLVAVANNDNETGLNWNKNQAQQINGGTVFVIPSERAGRLALNSPEDI